MQAETGRQADRRIRETETEPPITMPCRHHCPRCGATEALDFHSFGVLPAGGWCQPCYYAQFREARP